MLLLILMLLLLSFRRRQVDARCPLFSLFVFLCPLSSILHPRFDVAVVLSKMFQLNYKDIKSHQVAALDENEPIKMYLFKFNSNEIEVANFHLDHNFSL